MSFSHTPAPVFQSSRGDVGAFAGPNMVHVDESPKSLRATRCGSSTGTKSHRRIHAPAFSKALATNLIGSITFVGIELGFLARTHQTAAPPAPATTPTSTCADGAGLVQRDRLAGDAIDELPCPVEVEAPSPPTPRHAGGKLALAPGVLGTAQAAACRLSARGLSWSPAEGSCVSRP
jgi:hypothetical protein